MSWHWKEVSIFMLSLCFLWMSWPALGLTQRTYRSIAVDLLVAWQAGFHGRGLLLSKVPVIWRASLVDKLLCRSCSSCQLWSHRGWWRILGLSLPSLGNTFQQPENYKHKRRFDAITRYQLLSGKNNIPWEWCCRIHISSPPCNVLVAGDVEKGKTGAEVLGRSAGVKDSEKGRGGEG